MVLLTFSIFQWFYWSVSILFIFSLIFIISFNLYCCCCFNRMSCRYVTKSSWSNVSFNTIVSILTFFRDDLSIFVSRVLKSYYLYCVIVSFSLLCINISVQFSSVQSLSCVQLFATPWIAAHQASLSITNSRSSLRFMSIESVMPSNHLILCHPLLLPPSIFPSIRVFPNESALCIRWPKYWSFSFNISPSNENSGLIPLGLIGWISLQSKGLSRVFSNTIVQKHQFFST